MKSMFSVLIWREFLVRMLAAALRRDVGDAALDNLREGLLHALAGDVPCDRRVHGALPSDLVDLVDVYDALLCSCHIEVGGLQKTEEDILDILAHVSRFRQRRRVGYRERHLQYPGEGLRDVCLTAA